MSQAPTSGGATAQPPPVAAAPKPAAAPDEKAVAALKEQRAASSIGAQVILDFNEDGSKGARGGAGGDVVENSAARDKYLVGLGLDPVSPSGPPPGPKPEEPEPKPAAAAKPLSGTATRVSSLAAGNGGSASTKAS